MYKLFIILIIWASAANGQIIRANAFYTPLSVTSNYVGGNTMWFNATNSSSYSGSGTTWTNIVGGGNFTLVGSPTFNSSAPKSFTLNGTNQYFSSTTTLPINTNFYSFSFWVKYSTSQNGTLFSQRVGSPNFNQITVLVTGDVNASTNGTKILMNDVNDITGGAVVRTALTTTGYGDNNWHYIVCKRGTSQDSLFVDGSFNTNSSTTSIPNVGTGAYVYSGVLSAGGSSANSNYYNGNISALEVYNYSLSNATILSNWNAKKSYYGY